MAGTPDLLTRQSTIAVILVAFLALGACSAHGTANRQTADRQWLPVVEDPAFVASNGPLVLVDAAHGNFHTIDGRFAAFAGLLQQDGYRVQSADSAASRDLLEGAGVYVIANAIRGGDDAEWKLPTPPAFSVEEISVIERWVADGGSLLLLADHMPFPGATAGLASEFGVQFLNGFAVQDPQVREPLEFSREAGTLADHPITRGRSAGETIRSVTSFTGQAFRVSSNAQPLLTMPDGWVVLLPDEAWEFDDSTPSVPAGGLLQGVALRHGNGRVAIFGEAAMFTAQTSVRNGTVLQMGMNHPLAKENAQFVLNVLHWLTGQIGERGDD